MALRDSDCLVVESPVFLSRLATLSELLHDVKLAVHVACLGVPQLLLPKLALAPVMQTEAVRLVQPSQVKGGRGRGGCVGRGRGGLIEKGS